MSELTLDFEDNLVKDLQVFMEQNSIKQITLDLLNDFLRNHQYDDITTDIPTKKSKSNSASKQK